MPELGGVEAIAAIRAEFPDTRLMVVLQRVAENRKLLEEGIDYAATPKISAMNLIRRP